jgi:hypothetical protein
MFLLFLAIVVVINRIPGCVVDILGHRQRLAFGSFALGGFKLAHAPVIFPGIEDQMQPRQDLFDRRQLAGRTGFPARTCRALWTGFALGACFTARALGAGFALRTGFAALALGAEFALRAWFAARAFGPGPSGMALRAGASRLTRLPAHARWSLPSLPDNPVVRHVPAPADAEAIATRPWMMASLMHRINSHHVRTIAFRAKPASLLQDYAASHVTGKLSSPRNAQPPIRTGSLGSSRKPFSRAKMPGSATSATMAREAKAPAQ